MYLKTKTNRRGKWRAIQAAMKARLGRFITQRMPVAFGVEPSNACNANCTFCAYQYQERPKGVMTPEVFERALDEFCRLGGGDINFTPTVGDPLLDRGLIDKIRLARSRPEVKQIWFYTNMIAFHYFPAEEFLKSGVTSIRISTCVKDKATFEKIYRSPKYDQMMDNIATLGETNQRLGRPVRLMLFLRIPKPFEETLRSPDFLRIKDFFEEKDIIVLDDAFDSWGGRITPQDLPDGLKLYENPLDQTRAPCSELYRRINILHDGRVNNCVCRDLNGDLVIGDLKTQTMEEIWRGEDLARLRREWHQGKVPETCRGCERYVPADDYFAAQFPHILKTYLRRRFPFLRSWLGSESSRDSFFMPSD